VNVAAEEANATVAAGLTLAQDDGKLVFRQPCPKFRDGCCTVYDIRPPVCRRYRCALLIRLEAGQISVAEARDKVTTAKMLVARVNTSVPEAALAARRTAIWKSLKKGYVRLPAADKPPAARALLDIAALDSFLGLWFRKKKSDRAPVA
jgi:Fe-S-cluster containining protein